MEKIEHIYVLFLWGFTSGLILGAWIVYALFKCRVLTPGKHAREEWPFSRPPANSSRNSQSGSVMFAMFGAVALVGVVGASSMTILKGPVRTMAQVTRKTIAENTIIASSKLAIMAATNQANGGDCDGDLFIEPIPADAPNGAPAPAGGGLLPATIGASLQDPWSTRYALCSWDHGPDTGRCGGQTGLIAGGPTQNQYVLAVISAGPDRQFQTSCNAWVDANSDNEPDLPLLAKVPGSDDIVLGYTYAEANTAGGGLWVLKSGDPDKATIDKNLEVMDTTGTNVVFGLDRTAGVADFLAIKTDNIYARTTPNGVIAFQDMLRVKGYADLGPPTGIGSGGGGGSSLPSCGNEEILQYDLSDTKWDCIAMATAETDPKVGAVTSDKWCRGDGSKIVCDQDAPAAGGAVSCPSGFTLVENAGRPLGCIQNTENGTATWHTAVNTCFNSYGGRLPTSAERYIAVNNYSLTAETDDYEWLDDLESASSGTPAHMSAGAGGNTKYDGVESSTSQAYRCFIPAGGGGGGGGSDTLAGLSCSTNQIAKWNGSAWICAADETGGGGGSATVSMDVEDIEINYDEAVSNRQVNIPGTYKFCFLSTVHHDGENGAGCWIESRGTDLWRLRAQKYAAGNGGIFCRASCVNM